MVAPERGIRLTHSGTTPFEVDLDLSSFEGMGWIRRRLRGESGWMQVGMSTMDTYWGQWSTRIVVAVTDKGELLSRTVAEALLHMRGLDLREPYDLPDETLDGHLEMAHWDFLGRCDIKHLAMLDAAETELAAGIAAEQDRGETVLAEVEAYIAQLNRRRRIAIDEGARHTLGQRVMLLESRHEVAAAWLVRRLAGMRAAAEQEQADMLDMLQNHGALDVLQTVRWVTKLAAGNQFLGGRGYKLGTSGPVPEDWRGSRSSAELLNAAQRLGRMHSKIPLIAYLPEKEDQRRRAIDKREHQERQQQHWWGSTAHTDTPRTDRGLTASSPVARTEREPPILSRVVSEHELHVQAIAQMLREKALRKQAKIAASKLSREREVQTLIELYGSVEALDARLAAVPSMGSENRRLSRLIREAIARLTISNVGSASATDDVAFPVQAAVRTSPQHSAASLADHSIDIDALIDNELRDMLKDLR